VDITGKNKGFTAKRAKDSLAARHHSLSPKKLASLGLADKKV
jgi:hypothetical protein